MTIEIKNKREEYEAKVLKLRNDPMVKAWIAAYQIDSLRTYADCSRCNYPHSQVLDCNNATIGKLRLGGESYWISISNILFFHDFMLALGKYCGFHWRDGTYFKRTNDGSVEVRYIEPFNNTPQIKIWSIPPNEWASIIAAVSKQGETAESYQAALAFHNGEKS